MRSGVLASGVAAVAMVIGGCSSSDDQGAVDSVDTTVAVDASVRQDTEPISVSELLAREEQGRAGDNVLVAGLLFDDGAGMQLCETLAESFPPQCVGPSVTIRNPEAVESEVVEEQGVRWTDQPVWLFGWVEQGAFVIS